VMKSGRRHTGFTLIEMVCVLLIAGIITTVSGMAIVTAMHGYLFARDNASIGQRAQLALARINRELIEMTTITTAESGRITYQRIDGTGAVTRTIYKDDTDDTIRIALDGNAQNGNVLIDQVRTFAMNYYKESSGLPWGNEWTSTDPVAELTVIDFSFAVKRTDEERDMTFQTMVYPRNIRRF